MDHAWAAKQLQDFAKQIRFVKDLNLASWRTEGNDHRIEGDLQTNIEDLITLEPVMRELMNAARLGLGDYERPAGRSELSAEYWIEDVHPNTLRAIGVHTIGAEARERMRPDSPDFTADQFHPWVWDAAMSLWQAGSP